MQLILASSSPARLQTLRGAGIDPEVLVPDADESSVTAAGPSSLTAELARLKATTVLEQLHHREAPWAMVACDSMLELDQRAWGKPADEAAAVELWRRMRGRTALLHTGHHVVVNRDGQLRQVNRVATTIVKFADLTDAEIDAYVATGEPVRVAGGFAIDGLGGAFITRIDGDPYNVVGISLPLLRQMLFDLGVAWHTMWNLPTSAR
ncbi:Maf family protein [Luteococcus sp. Sow4_B9]|uniref:Maf family protein n=1 Tax=Luteococcus sp. Sow4_B9 TaxID=3438792 RepID=UPI003F9AFCE4